MQNVALIQREVVPGTKLNYNMYMYSWLTWIGDGLVNPALLISAMISAATPKMYTLSKAHKKTWILPYPGDKHV